MADRERCGTRSRPPRSARTRGSPARPSSRCPASWTARRSSRCCAASSREQMVARGMVADFAVHDVRARDGGRQPHAHVMTTTRAIDPTKPLGFGGKVRAWDDKALVLEWREAWAEHVNARPRAGGGRGAGRPPHARGAAARRRRRPATSTKRGRARPRAGAEGRLPRPGRSSARASRPSAATCCARCRSATRSGARSTSEVAEARRAGQGAVPRGARARGGRVRGLRVRGPGRRTSR